MTSTLKLVKQVINLENRVLVLDYDLVQLPKVNGEKSFFFFMNNIGAPHEEILGLMNPLSRRSFTCSFYSLSSAGAISIRRNRNRLSIWKEINSKLNFPFGRNPGKLFWKYFWRFTNYWNLLKRWGFKERILNPN